MRTYIRKRSSCASGSGNVPSCSIGFCVAITRNSARQRIGLAADGDLALAHRLEQRRLHLRRRAVDLVGEQHRMEDRAGLEFEAAVLRAPDLGAGEVGRQQVGRELHAGEIGFQARRQCPDRAGLGQARARLRPAGGRRRAARSAGARSAPPGRRSRPTGLSRRARKASCRREVSSAAAVHRASGRGGAGRVGAQFDRCRRRVGSVTPGMHERPETTKGPEGPFAFSLRRPLSCAARRGRTFGVTKISSSALLLVWLRFLNRLPRIGMSPRNGTLDRSCWSLNSYTPPITTVWPSSTSTAVLTSRLAMLRHLADAGVR